MGGLSTLSLILQCAIRYQDLFKPLLMPITSLFKYAVSNTMIRHGNVPCSVGESVLKCRRDLCLAVSSCIMVEHLSCCHSGYLGKCDKWID